MKRRIQRLTHFSGWFVILVAILSRGIPISLTTEASAQISQTDDARSERAKEARQVTKEFFDSLVAGNFSQTREYLSPSIREYISAADIQQQWQRILDTKGAFVKYSKIRPMNVFSNNYTVLVTANFENSIPDFVVTLDPNLQITAVDFLLIGNNQASAEEFVGALANSQYGVARSYLTPDLKKKLLPETLEQRWQEIIETTGPFESLANSRVVENSGSDIVIVELDFERETRSFALFLIL